MNQEQIAQFMNQQFSQTASFMPWWIKAFYFLCVVALLANAVCLPLITWLLYRQNIQAAHPTEQTLDRRAAQSANARSEVYRGFAGAINPTGEQLQPVSTMAAASSDEVEQAFHAGDERFQKKS